MDFQGNIPTFLHIFRSKYRDSNLFIMPIEKDAIYVMDKDYVEFEALFAMEQTEAFFVTRAKQNMVFDVTETNYNIDPKTGLVRNQTIVLTGLGLRNFIQFR
jgi:transposase